jgi:hypothetical protein
MRFSPIYLIFFGLGLSLSLTTKGSEASNCPYPENYQIQKSSKTASLLESLEGDWNFTIQFSKLKWIVKLFVGIDVDLPARVSFKQNADEILMVKACIPRAQAIYLLEGKEKHLSNLYKFLNYCDDPALTEVPVYRTPDNSRISFYTIEVVKDKPARRHQIELALQDHKMDGRIFNCDGNLHKFGINFKGKTLILLDGRKVGE